MKNHSTETIKYLTSEQVEKLLDKMINRRDKTMFSLMYLYGLRCAEAASLKVTDIRIDDGRIYIRAKKNGISGEYVLNKDAKRILNAYLEERNKKRVFSDILFLSKKGGELSTTQIRRLFAGYARKAKLPADKLHPHTLRHSIAVHMADSGTPVEVVRVHLRHRKIESTMVYFEITNKRRHEMQQQALSGVYVARI